MKDLEREHLAWTHPHHAAWRLARLLLLPSGALLLVFGLLVTTVAALRGGSPLGGLEPEPVRLACSSEPAPCLSELPAELVPSTGGAAEPASTVIARERVYRGLESASREAWEAWDVRRGESDAARTGVGFGLSGLLTLGLGLFASRRARQTIPVSVELERHAVTVDGIRTAIHTWTPEQVELLASRVARHDGPPARVLREGLTLRMRAAAQGESASPEAQRALDRLRARED